MNTETKLASSTALIAVAAAVSSANSALAADLHQHAHPVFAPAPIATWQGFYVGGSLGGAWLNTTQDDTGAVSNLSGGYYNSSGSSSQTANGLGFMGGLQAGYNFQDGNFVYGIEGDISWIGGNSASSTSSQPVLLGPYGYGSLSGQKTSKVDALATLRARFGLDFNGTMPYLTAGLAVGQIKNSYTASGYANFTASKTSWEPGLALGGGIEHRFANSPWTIKGEVLWIGFKNTVLNAAYGGYTTPVKFQHDLVIGRIGLNYRF